MYDPNVPPPPPGMMQTMGAPSGIAGLPMQGQLGDRGRLSGLFGPDFNRQGYVDLIRQWISTRPSDPAALQAWKAQMPSPFGMTPQATPAAPSPYPVTQLPTQQPVSPVTQIAPVPPQGGVGAPQQPPISPGGFPAPQQGVGGGFAPPGVGRRSNAGGGFFGTRKGR
jgi:hypothetical protein